jgi:hypothetical protein
LAHLAQGINRQAAETFEEEEQEGEATPKHRAKSAGG